MPYNMEEIFERLEGKHETQEDILQWLREDTNGNTVRRASSTLRKFSEILSEPYATRDQIETITSREELEKVELPEVGVDIVQDAIDERDIALTKIENQEQKVQEIIARREAEMSQEESDIDTIERAKTQKDLDNISFSGRPRVRDAWYEKQDELNSSLESEFIDEVNKTDSISKLESMRSDAPTERAEERLDSRISELEQEGEQE